MSVIRSISLFTLLWAICSSGAGAQRREPAFPEQPLGTPVLNFGSTLPDSEGTKNGVIWSGVGAITGTLVAFPIVAFLGLSLCNYGDAQSTCSLALVPFGIGATMGAALGAETGGDRRAWVTTLIGAAVGTAAAIVAPEADNGSTVVELGLFILPPAVGAWLGNRLGQRL